METSSNHVKGRRSEFWSTVMISLAAVLSAWCAYQATRWYGDMTLDFSEAITYRNESIKSEGDAGREMIIDMLTFQQWLEATDHKDSLLALAIEDRFRDEFVPAFNEWRKITEKGKAGLFAKGTPFGQESYKPSKEIEAETLVHNAETAFLRARKTARYGDNYIFAVVLFSLCLFFAAISDKVQSKFAVTVMLIMAVLFLVSGIIFILALPVNIAF